jgi:hypothetical protein
MTTCKNVITAKAIINETVLAIAGDRCSFKNNGSSICFIVGSPNHPSPKAVIVIPN